MQYHAHSRQSVCRPSSAPKPERVRPDEGCTSQTEADRCRKVCNSCNKAGLLTVPEQNLANEQAPLFDVIGDP